MKLFFNKIQTVVRSIKWMKSPKDTVMPQGTKQSTSPGVGAWLRHLCSVAGEWGKSFDGHVVSFQFTKGRNLEHRNSMLISFICDWRCLIVAIVSIVKWPLPSAPSVHISFCVPVTTAWYVLWLRVEARSSDTEVNFTSHLCVEPPHCLFHVFQQNPYLYAFFSFFLYMLHTPPISYSFIWSRE